MEKNNWRIATIILGVICVVLLTIAFVTPHKTLSFDKDNFEIKEQDFKNIVNQYDVGETIKICDFDKHCINIKKIE